MRNFKKLFLSTAMAIFISIGIYIPASANSNLEEYSIDFGKSKSTYIELTDGTNRAKTYRSSKWEKVDGKWYYTIQGVKQKGWVKDSNKWYYLDNNGVMKIGWIDLNGTWYYLKDSGVMATGWQQVGNHWYYLKSSGAMYKGWLDLNGKWYYLENSGIMATGWKQLGSKWYYLYSNGVMATSTTIDGWKINSNGVATYIGGNGSNSNNNNNLQNLSTVYITPNGKSYHKIKDCTALKRSSKIIATTLSNAKAQGKSDPCNLCVK